MEMKRKPGKSAVVFLVLHEVTAILAFPVVYPLASLTSHYGLSLLPVTARSTVDGYLEKANKRINRMRNRVGYDDLAVDHPLVMNLALSYFYVKCLMPVRLGMCVYLTPLIVNRFR